ncbi:hypothetical protein C7B79_32505, partial [Chroococcidiopsis cubana CCALA 043]
QGDNYQLPTTHYQLTSRATFFLAPFLRGLGDRQTTPLTKRSLLTHATLLKSGNPPTQVAPLEKGGNKSKRQLHVA